MQKERKTGRSLAVRAAAAMRGQCVWIQATRDDARERAVRLAFAVSAGSLLLSGCAAVITAASVGSNAAMVGAATMDSGVQLRSVQKNFLEERGVDVSLIPYNWNLARDSKYFSVAVDFTTDLKNPPRLNADFRQFSLNLPDGKVVHPIGYALTYPDTISQGCRRGTGKDSLPPFKARASYDIRALPDAPLRIRSNAWSIASECYDVIFPVATISPKEKFSIDVAGIFIDGAPMRRERVFFEERPDQ